MQTAPQQTARELQHLAAMRLPAPWQWMVMGLWVQAWWGQQQLLVVAAAWQQAVGAAWWAPCLGWMVVVAW